MHCCTGGFFSMLGFLLLPFCFLDETMTVSIEKLLQVFYLLTEFATYIGIGNQHAAVRHFYNLCGTLDVGTLLDGIFHTRKWLVLDQLESAGVIY